MHRTLRSLAIAIMLVVVCVFVCGSHGAVTCTSDSSISLTVHWEPELDSDVYYVALSRTPTERPFALQTTANYDALTVIDLLPSTTYYVSVRSHPSSENIVWGWRAPSDPIECTTTATRTNVPHNVRRVGAAAEEHRIHIQWNAPSPMSPLAAETKFKVGVRQSESLDVEATNTWIWEMPNQEMSHILQNLTHGQTYDIVVLDVFSGLSSDKVVMRTATTGAIYTTAYRISEYTFDVDFLENHDGANTLAMPVYVQNNGGMNETAVTHEHGQNYSMDVCLAAMTAACPDDRGNSFTCMRCTDQHRTTIDKACGNYSDGDNIDGWAVHFYCGIGWPGSSFQRSPITEYCVEHAEAPQTDPVPGGDGFAQYVSCNSDECDGALLPEGNTAKKPTCICWVWDDRMLSQQVKNNTLAACSTDVQIPWVGANQCNCSLGKPGTEATMLPVDSPMANYVGRSKVYLPYYYYTSPQDTYPVSVLVGDNLSFPRKGACNETQKIGDNNCTWKRLSTSRMLYGDNLLKAGWNATMAFPNHLNVTHQNEIDHTFKNIDAFNRARDNLDTLRSPRCCGC